MQPVYSVPAIAAMILFFFQTTNAQLCKGSLGDPIVNITFGAGAISKSHLTVNAKVPGISKEKFDECAKDAKENCPISKSLSSNIEISMDATLS